MLLWRRRVHLHKSANFKMLSPPPKFIKIILELFPKRSNNQFKNNSKHDSEKQWKISSKGRPEAPESNQRSPKGTARVRKAPPGSSWNSDCFRFFADPSQGIPTTFPSPPAAPKSLPKVSQMVNIISKSTTRPHLHNTWAYSIECAQHKRTLASPLLEPSFKKWI